MWILRLRLMTKKMYGILIEEKVDSMTVKTLVNEDIKAKRVIFITSEGENRGEMTTEEAFLLANEAGFDLVQVSDGKKSVPVCKLVDYGKMKYKQSKKEKKNKKHEDIKEMRISLNIAENDINVKNKKTLKFLEKGHRVKYVLRLKGRQRRMVDEAKEKMNSIIKIFENIAVWDDINVSENTISVLMKPIHLK